MNSSIYFLAQVCAHMNGPWGFPGLPSPEPSRASLRSLSPDPRGDSGEQSTWLKEYSRPKPLRKLTEENLSLIRDDYWCTLFQECQIYPSINDTQWNTDRGPQPCDLQPGHLALGGEWDALEGSTHRTPRLTHVPLEVLTTSPGVTCEQLTFTASLGTDSCPQLIGRSAPLPLLASSGHEFLLTIPPGKAFSFGFCGTHSLVSLQILGFLFH